MNFKNVIAGAIIGLYILVTLTLLIWNISSDAGDMTHFFDQMSKANFLLGPVGFIIGYYFKRDVEK